MMRLSLPCTVLSLGRLWRGILTIGLVLAAAVAQAADYRGDANNRLYQWESSGDYNPAPGLENIQAMVLAVNAADEERNPPETGIMEREMKRIKDGPLLPDPGQRPDRGPWHHPAGEVVSPATGAVAADSPAAGAVTSRGNQSRQA